VNSHICSNKSPFIKGLIIFTMINLFNFTQNLVKHIMNLDTCSVMKSLILGWNKKFYLAMHSPNTLANVLKVVVDA